MKKTQLKRSVSLLLCSVLLAATTLSFTACKDTEKTTADTQAVSVTTENAAQTAEKTVLGEGTVVFDFTSVDADGNTAVFEIHTEEKTVGAALLNLGLIAGDEGDYGLYVKTVNGVTYDYDTDGKYWAFYVNGEYGMNGVDTTEIEAGASYSFKAE